MVYQCKPKKHFWFFYNIAAVLTSLPSPGPTPTPINVQMISLWQLLNQFYRLSSNCSIAASRLQTLTLRPSRVAELMLASIGSFIHWTHPGSSGSIFESGTSKKKSLDLFASLLRFFTIFATFSICFDSVGFQIANVNGDDFDVIR